MFGRDLLDVRAYVSGFGHYRFAPIADIRLSPRPSRSGCRQESCERNEASGQSLRRPAGRPPRIGRSTRADCDTFAFHCNVSCGDSTFAARGRIARLTI
jgi:hypothetical protein